MSAPVVVAVDLGGSTMKGAIIAEDGVTIATQRATTPEHDIVEGLGALIQDLITIATGSGHPIVALGVVTPGIVDEESGVVRYASNLDWHDFPLLEILATRFSVPVAVGHDVRAAGLAEQLFGAARGASEFVLIPIGTGVAAALVSRDGTITGATGAAGEVGHIPVIPNGELCTCGQTGCLEVYMSGAGVARRYAARGGEQLSSEQIVGRLGSDAVADAVWDEAVQVLSQGLRIVTLLLDPEVIVIGGGIAHAGSALLDPLLASMSDGLVWRDAPRVELSQLGSEAGLIGAAVMAFRSAKRGSVVESWPVGMTTVL